MSSEKDAAFPIEKNSDGSFSVNINGKITCVDTHEAASLLSILPVVVNLVNNTPESLNVEEAEKMIAVYDECRLNPVGLRRVKSYLTRRRQSLS